ncbi:MAG: hypothetical protein IKS00_04545 [Bacteroidales bacterium]|nr:hypothetical protein [Bacteroidales bacterium]
MSDNKRKSKLDLSAEAFPFVGKIQINEAGFAFVQFNGVGIYIAPKLLKNNTINNGDMVQGEFVSSFDKKKKQDGYTAVKIHKAE